MTIQSIVCNCFNATKRSFCITMWQWMKHGSTTSLWSQIGSQLSGQQQVKAIQSNQRRKHQQARFWPPYFRMRKVFCSLITLRKEEPSSEYYVPLLVRLKEEIAKKQSQMEKKKVLFHQNNALCHKLITTMAKLHELLFELLPHPPYSSDQTPSDY